MVSHEELFALRRAERGRLSDPYLQELCGGLAAQAFLAEKQTWLGRRLRLTGPGREELLRARHSGDLVARAIATGIFDHVPVSLFTQLISSPDIEKFVKGQRTAQMLLILSHLVRPR